MKHYGLQTNPRESKYWESRARFDGNGSESHLNKVLKK